MPGMLGFFAGVRKRVDERQPARAHPGENMAHVAVAHDGRREARVADRAAVAMRRR